MRRTAPTLRDLHTNRHTNPRPRAPRRFWDDPDLAPPARKEVPLSFW